MEDVVAQGRENPALGMKHALFDEPLVPGPPNPSRKALDAVMVEQIGVGRRRSGPSSPGADGRGTG